MQFTVCSPLMAVSFTEKPLKSPVNLTFQCSRILQADGKLLLGEGKILTIIIE